MEDVSVTVVVYKCVSSEGFVVKICYTLRINEGNGVRLNVELVNYLPVLYLRTWQQLALQGCVVTVTVFSHFSEFDDSC